MEGGTVMVLKRTYKLKKIVKMVKRKRQYNIFLKTIWQIKKKPLLERFFMNYERVLTYTIILHPKSYRYTRKFWSGCMCISMKPAHTGHFLFNNKSHNINHHIHWTDPKLIMNDKSAYLNKASSHPFS